MKYGRFRIALKVIMLIDREFVDIRLMMV